MSQCPHYKKCGGCQLQNMTYEKQLSFKQVKIIRLLGRFCHVDEIIGMDEPFHYRNKVQAAFGMKNGKMISGVYQSSTHNIVPVDDCLIEDEVADRIIVTIRKLATSFKMKPFNDVTMKGFLRHVLVKRGFLSGQVMVVLVTASGAFPSQRSFINALLGKHPEITTIVRNINDKHTSLVLGERSETLFGSGYIEEQLCGMTFRISPKSFYQINPKQTEVLYNTAMEFAGLTGSERVIDAYCGTGTIGLIMSKNAGEVIGVELNKDAVKDAKNNAALNNVSNIQFFCGDAGRFMVEMAEMGEKADVVMTDPPRAGCSLDFLKSVVKLSPKRVVYVSCNPETLARDLGFLTRKGYKAVKIQPVDMFPFTEHVETVVLLSKLKSPQHIEVELKTDELDLTSAESKATYDEIKAYVKEHAGLTVSSLNIAQVKQKYGIIERENYNKAKSKNSRQPKCPKEKEEAIVEAMKFFKMI
ncbi:MAG: 23S rRNA (uracil(1939)-C(5))-methyltransferase RlmD [Ruminococcaceae bacterium]|nr:23S rRNA (uracil(1939)-C(5))-methyltransferase RlmD [Oscillospiraceae bacterium]